MWFAALAVLCWQVALAQTHRPQHPPEIEKLVDWARAVSTEFRADVLFRLIDAGKIDDPAWKREILEDLFSTALQAQYPLALSDVGLSTDTRSWAVARGLDFKLDTLSIRCRVVKQMIALDPKRALDLFTGMVPPAIANPGCEDALVPNVGLWYETAREVADRSFLPAERAKGDPMQFFEPYLRSIGSSLQVAPAGMAIRTVQANAEQRQKLVDIFASRLAAIDDGYLAFSFALHRLGLFHEITQLGESVRQKGLSADNLIAAYRAFLVKHLTGPGCAAMRARKEDPVLEFNERLRWAGYLTSADLKAITKEESNAESKTESIAVKMDRKTRIVDYWQTPQSKRLLATIKHLHFGDSSSPQPEYKYLTAEQKQTVEWQNEVRQFLGDLAAWNSRDEPSAADYFHQRAILYSGLIDLIPSGALRDNVVQSYMAFLSQNPIETESPVQFLEHLNAVFQLARPLSSAGAARVQEAQHNGAQLPGLPVENGQAILDALAASKDSVIPLYGSLEKVAPRTHDH